MVAPEQRHPDEIKQAEWLTTLSLKGKVRAAILMLLTMNSALENDPEAAHQIADHYLYGPQDSESYVEAEEQIAEAAKQNHWSEGMGAYIEAIKIELDKNPASRSKIESLLAAIEWQKNHLPSKAA